MSTLVDVVNRKYRFSAARFERQRFGLLAREMYVLTH